MPPRRNLKVRQLICSKTCYAYRVPTKAAEKNNQETADGSTAADMPKKGPGRPQKATVVASPENEASAPPAPNKERKKPTQAATAAEDSTNEAPPPKVTKTRLKKATANVAPRDARCITVA